MVAPEWTFGPSRTSGTDSLLNDAPGIGSVEAVLPDGSSPWPITRALGRAIAHLIAMRRPRSVLEFGAGASSVVIASALAAAGGGRLTSLEHRPQFSRAAWARASTVANVDARLLAAPLRLRASGAGLHVVYAVAGEILAARAPFDLVVIDAPPFYYGRDGALHMAYRHLAPGAMIILDDAGRAPEKRMVDRWLKRYPGLQLLELSEHFGGGKGAAVLRLREALPPRASLAVIAGSLADRIAGLRHVRHHWRELRLSSGGREGEDSPSV